MKEKKKATRDATKDWEHFAKRTQWIGQKCLQSVINKHVYKISDILIGCNERMKRKKELLATNEYKRMKCERSRKIYVSQMHLKLITSPSCWFSFTLFSLLKSFKPTNRLKQKKKERRRKKHRQNIHFTILWMKHRLAPVYRNNCIPTKSGMNKNGAHKKS